MENTLNSLLSRPTDEISVSNDRNRLSDQDFIIVQCTDIYAQINRVTRVRTKGITDDPVTTTRQPNEDDGSFSSRIRSDMEAAAGL